MDHLEQELKQNKKLLREGEKEPARYEELRRNLESLGGELEVLQDSRDRAVEDRDSISTGGVTRLNDLIQKVSSKFGDYFAELGYNGEVTLSRGEETDYKSYGVAIKVCLFLLITYTPTTTTSSPTPTCTTPTSPPGEVPSRRGVERASQGSPVRRGDVCHYCSLHAGTAGDNTGTTPATISSQELTTVPFRCVDEINQGLDEKNERRVWSMILAAATHGGGSQYFYLAPKVGCTGRRRHACHKGIVEEFTVILKASARL